MTTDTLHPDHLQPGHMVGPWRIVERLGVGGSSRVFKVEREGFFFALKMALRPLATEEEEEEETSWRMTREVAALLTYSPLPNLLRIHAVDCWPHPRNGYLFFVTDFVDGETWHGWRWKTPPHATALLDAFCEVVRTLGVLHSRGVYHRDLKAENILIRREDAKPFIIDFGNVRLPGALTKTLGLPPGVIHLLPPEVLAYARSEVWKEGVPFKGGAAADLYALGMLLYQGLTDLHPFDPKLPDEMLLTTIATVAPEAPHLLNPRAPRVLSDIAMKLLEKRPEDRYPDTDTLLRALWNAGKERTSSAWKVPLFAAEDEPAPLAPEEAAVAPAQPPEAPHVEPEPPQTPPPQEEHQAADEPIEPARPRRAKWPWWLLTGLMVLGLALWLARPTLTPPSEVLMPGAGHFEKGSPSVSTALNSTPSRLLAAWLCAVAGLGCPSAQVKPPEPADCPQEAQRAMEEDFKIFGSGRLRVIVDINQPGEQSDRGIYQDGPVIGRIVEGQLPAGTLLHGRLWTGPGIYEIAGKEKTPAVIGHYTLAILPDGRKYPVCIVLGNPKDDRIPKDEGSKPGAAIMGRQLPASAVTRWP